MQEGVFGLAVSARLGRPRESIVLSGGCGSGGAIRGLRGLHLLLVALHFHDTAM